MDLLCQVGSYSDGITHMLTHHFLLHWRFQPGAYGNAALLPLRDAALVWGWRHRRQGWKWETVSVASVSFGSRSICSPTWVICAATFDSASWLPGTIFWIYEPVQLLSLGFSVETPRAVACWRRGFGQCAAAVSQRLHLLPHSWGPLAAGQMREFMTMTINSACVTGSVQQANMHVHVCVCVKQISYNIKGFYTPTMKSKWLHNWTIYVKTSAVWRSVRKTVI